MTEAEWDQRDDPEAMLAFLQGKGCATDRRLRLFAVACCQRVAHLLTDERFRRAVEVAERYADGLADERERAAALADADRAVRELRGNSFQGPALARTGLAVAMASIEAAGAANSVVAPAAPAQATARRAARAAVLAELNTLDPVTGAVDTSSTDRADTAKAVARSAQARLVRCIFGVLPFRRVAFTPAWTAPTGVSLARAIYEEQDWGRLQVLADALEEAGCTDTDALNHLRQPGVHARGCWVVDRILGKA